MGAGSAWGSAQELQHPRDSHGRFRNSWKMAEGVIHKITALLDKFNPKTFGSDQDAQTYVHTRSRGNRFLTNNHAAIDRFLRGFSSVNAKLEAGDTSSPEVAAIDKAMDPLPDDLILTRTMSPESFGLTAQNIGQIEELTGKLVTSKGYTSTNIGTPYQRQPGTITMTIAASAGTKAVIPNLSRPSKEIILGRDQPLRITKVEPDGTGGWNVLAVADGASEGETPVDIAKAVPEAGIPEAAPEAPQTPAAPGGPTPGTGDLGAPLSRKPGRPAGPPPAARNEGHVADNVGGGQAPESPSAQTPTPEPAPSAPEPPPAPEAGPDARNTFREAFDKADLQVPTVGTRRKQFMDAYNGVASGKKTPQEAVNDLDNAISANKKIIASDKLDGTDSGPLPEDVRRQEALRDLIAEHFNFTGRKQFKESSGEAKATPTKKAAPAPVAPAAEAPAASGLKAVFRDTEVGPARPEVNQISRELGLKKITTGEADARLGRLQREHVAAQADAEDNDDTAKANRHADAVDGIQQIRDALGADREQRQTAAKKAAAPLREPTPRVTEKVAPKAAAPEKKPEPERVAPGIAAGKTNASRVQVGEKILVSQNKDGEWVPATKKTGATTITVTGKSAAKGRAGLRRQGPQRTVIHGEDENGNKIDVRSAPSHQTFFLSKEKAPAKKAAPEAPKKSNEELDAEIAQKERERKAQIRKDLRAEREARGEQPTKAAPAKAAEPTATEKARTETLIKSLERSREPKKAVPAPQRPQIPAKDLSDKGLMQRFEAEIKKDNPDEARLKELGDELDRRDLETKNRVQGLSDTDLEKKFQAEIRKDNPDEEEMRRLGDELDRRDADRAAKEKKIDDLVAKGRDYRDAWAEVNGKDPDLLDLEERKSLLDQSRRAGESRETTLRRLYQEHVHRQYLDAERVTRGHLLTPEGRSKGIDPKSLFQGSNVNANRYASDELKEYWEKNPRKTFIQYKADTLGRKEDVAAAKKTEGVARDLELGEKLKRKSPQKRVPEGRLTEMKEAPKEQPAVPAPTKRVREAGGGGGFLETPESVQGRFRSIAEKRNGWSQRSQHLSSPLIHDSGVAIVNMGGGGKKFTVVTDSDAPNAKKVPRGTAFVELRDAVAWAENEGPNLPPMKEAAPEAPSNAPEAPDIDKMTVPQLRDEAKRQNKRIPSNITRKADIVDFLKGGGAKEDSVAIRESVKGALDKQRPPEPGSLDEARAELNKVTIAKLREEAGNRGIDIPKSARLKKDVIEAIIRGMAQQELDKRRGGAPEVEAPEVPEAPDIDKMTIAQLKDHAAANELQVPRALRLKAEIRDWIKESLARKKEGIAPERVQTQREIKKENIAARGRLREMDRKAKLTQEEFEAEARGVNRGSAPTLFGEDLKKRFDAMKSSQEGDDLMVAMDPSRAELVDMAKSLNIAHKASANKQEIKDQILHWGLRRRLQSEAVSRPGATGGSRVLKNAAERPGPKRSPKPKIENTWGVPGGEVNFHEDGNIGSTIQGLTQSGDADLMVNGDRLDNTLGKEATRLVRGDISQTELIDKLRSMSVQLDGNGSPEAARLIRRAADRMSTPEIKRPELPEGTPEPIQKLMDRLVDTPLARGSGPGGRDNEVEALTKLMKDWEDGKVSAIGLPMKIREATHNRRHESNEGKFQIDRAVNDAVQAIEDMGRKDRNSLRPPSRRAEHANQPLPQRVPREALKSDLSDASMPELRAVAQSEGVQVPGSMRSKAEVAKYLTDVRQEKNKLNTMPELKGQPETLARIEALKEAMKAEPDSRIAPSWGDAPDMIMSNAVEGLRDGSLDNPMVSRMLADIDGFVPKDSPLRKLIKDARNDLDDIYINAQGGGGNIGPEKYHVGSTQGVEDLIRDVTPEALSNPATKRDRISTGQVGANAKVTLPSGKVVFEKTSKRVGYRSGESSSDAEQLLPAIGTSLGAPTMPTMRMSPDTIYTDWVEDYTPGQNIISDISDTPNPGMEEIWARLKDSREGKILGLIDMITFNGDRHGSNWGIDGGGKLVAIDNGMGWGFTDFEEISPGVDLMKIDLEENVFPNLADRFTMQGFFNEDTDGLMNPNFTIADMEKVRARLEALREQFRHLKREQWLDLSLKAVDILKKYATGTEDMFE